MCKSADGKTRVAQAPLIEVIGYIKQNWRTFFCHNVGFALLSFSSYGSVAWIPTFFVRNHGWSEAKAGQVLGWIIAIAGTLGIVAGGQLADWMSERGRRDATMRVGLIAAIAWLPSGVLYPLVSNSTWAAALLIPTAFLASAPFGVSAAAIQQMMPNAMRGQASAIYLFAVNLIGLGLGPSAVAAVTDFVFQNDKSVRYSLLCVEVFGHLGSAVLLFAGIKPFLASLERLESWNAANA